ncbi:MAG: hypothetical protein LBN11_00530 [Tannerella sp.]|jgi:tetratricopeptide (TPR) repeat protein|nr:hypothetical protein [Tannerella sp.]
MKRLFLTLGLCIAFSAAFGQKKAVADALKLAKAPTPNIAEARTKIKAALENAETKGDAKTWFTAGEIERIALDAEITKQVLGQQPNEVNMYAALGSLYPYYSEAYKLDNLPDEKGKVKPKYTKEMKNVLKANLPYYINGGAYFFEKLDYKKGYDFFNTYIEISDSKLLKEGEKAGKTDVAVPVDSNYIYSIYYAALASSQIKDHNIAVAAMKRAGKQEYKQNEILQYLVEEYRNVADTANMEITLNEGLALFPQDQHFLLHMINIYMRTNRSDKALEYIKTALIADPTNANLYEVAGSIYESHKDIEKAEEYFLKSVELDPEIAESQLNMGSIYFNKAVSQLDAASSILDGKKYAEEKEKANEWFKKALPYLEKSFKLNPDIPETRVALRNIYYNLNMGDKLDEIEKLMGY